MLYARRRFLRIWPAYAVVVLIGAALQNIHHGQHFSSPTDVAAHLTMLHGFSAKYIWGAGNMPLWTMAVDAQFYVALPIAAWAMLRLSGKRGELRSRVILASIGGAVALSLAWRIFATYTFPTQVWPPSADLQVVQRGIVGMGMCFALGGLVAFASARNCHFYGRRGGILLNRRLSHNNCLDRRLLVPADVARFCADVN